jgi:S-adenosylmethionine synthetase
MAESIAVAYTRWCREQIGMPLHHNFDKVQLVAGEVALEFGGGVMLKPIRIQIAGRGTARTPGGRPVPIDLIAIEAARDYLRRTMRHLDPDRHCVIDCFAGQGARELTHTVSAITANDTSVGVAHWPPSPLEAVVLRTCRALNGTLRDRFPIGEDVKVMGARLEEEITLTCAVPFLAQQIPDGAAYRAGKEAVVRAIGAVAAEVANRPVQIRLNMADHEAEGDVYLTLTGTSGEQGDDGAVGRGNRVNGLITPCRPSSLEAAAGKNAISHVGKLYNVLARETARALVAEVDEVRQAQVYFLSQIGQPLEKPQVAAAQIEAGDQRLEPALVRAVEAVVEAQLNRIDTLREAILAGKIALF